MRLWRVSMLLEVEALQSTLKGGTIYLSIEQGGFVSCYKVNSYVMTAH